MDEAKRSSAKKKAAAIKKKLNKLTEEQLKAAIQRKKECTARAMTIVERLIEPDVNSDWLLNNLVHINQSHLQDVAEERALTKICGYPLCDSPLLNVPSKQFHISTKLNKVYDITDRKNFCSNVCYQAGVFLKGQLYTSPLWLRDCEDPVAYKLFSSDISRGSTGIEVDLGESVIKADVPGDKTPVQAELPPKDTQDSVQDVTDAVRDMVIEKRTEKRKSQFKEGVSLKKNSGTDSRSKVDSVISTWFTLDSLNFLFGHKKVKDLFADFTTSKQSRSQSDFVYERYEEICRRLNVLELQDEAAPPSRPVPDFVKLKEEAAELELKVKSFFQGDSLKSVRFEDEENSDDKSKDEVPSILPVIDQHAVRAARRRIVMEKMSRMLPDIQRVLDLNQIDIRSDIRQLVFTLSLTPTNITMKPAEWTLVIVAVIKFLTLQNETLNAAYSSPLSQKKLNDLLSTYGLDLSYLDRQMSALDNFEQIVINSAL